MRRSADTDAAAELHRNITPLMLDVTQEDSIAAAAQQVAAVNAPSTLPAVCGLVCVPLALTPGAAVQSPCHALARAPANLP